VGWPRYTFVTCGRETKGQAQRGASSFRWTKAGQCSEGFEGEECGVDIPAFIKFPPRFKFKKTPARGSGGGAVFPSIRVMEGLGLSRQGEESELGSTVTISQEARKLSSMEKDKHGKGRSAKPSSVGKKNSANEEETEQHLRRWENPHGRHAIRPARQRERTSNSAKTIRSKNGRGKRKREGRASQGLRSLHLGREKRRKAAGVQARRPRRETRGGRGLTESEKKRSSECPKVPYALRSFILKWRTEIISPFLDLPSSCGPPRGILSASNVRFNANPRAQEKVRMADELLHLQRLLQSPLGRREAGKGGG